MLVLVLCWCMNINKFHVSFHEDADWFMCSINRWVLSCNISKTTQHTNTGQAPARTQEAADSTYANIVETSTCFETTQQETTNFIVQLLIGLAHVQLRPWVFKAVTATKIYCKFGLGGGGGALGIVSMLKSLKRKAQTTMSENRYTSLKIDIFRMTILSLLASIGNNAQASFLVHQVPCISATVL